VEVSGGGIEEAGGGDIVDESWASSGVFMDVIFDLRVKMSRFEKSGQNGRKNRRYFIANIG